VLGITKQRYSSQANADKHHNHNNNHLENSMRPPHNRIFRVVPKAGQRATIIIADTLDDARCQARELCDGNKPHEFTEVFASPMHTLNAQFSSIFA